MPACVLQFLKAATRLSALIGLGAMLTAPVALAHGDIEVEDAWSRELPPVSANGAAYLVIKNPGDHDDRLVSAKTPRAERVEIHTHEMVGNLMKMRELEDGLKIAAEGEVRLQPGGNHLMLIKLSKPLKAGDTFPMTLEFEDTGEIAVTVKVLSMEEAARRSSGHGKKHSHGHGKKHDH